MPSYFSLFTFLLVLFHGFSIHAQELESPWKLAKKSDDIKISYRFIESGDTLKIREMKISFLVKSTPEKLVQMFREPTNLVAWSAGVKKCELLNETADTWLMYNCYKIPWPFMQKDLITKYSMEVTSKITTLLMTSKPNQIPHYKDISRLENYKGRWVFKTDFEGITHVEFYSISFTKPIVPRFLQDPIIQRAFIESIQKLKEIVSS